MRRYFRVLLLVAVFFLFSVNTNALKKVDVNNREDLALDYGLGFIVNELAQDNLNPEGRDTNDINDPGITNDVNDPDVNNNVNDPNFYNTDVNDPTDVNDDPNDTDNNNELAEDQNNFLTVLSAGIIGGLIGSAIIYLLVVRNR